MARVTPEEARDSERVAAFAKELGNRAPRYREGEIVAVNERGWTYRLTPESTGASRVDIHNFAAELKDKALPSMGEARAAQIAAHSKGQPTEPWHQRDASKTEMKISGIQEAADRGGISAAVLPCSYHMKPEWLDITASIELIHATRSVRQVAFGLATPTRKFSRGVK